MAGYTDLIEEAVQSLNDSGDLLRQVARVHPDLICRERRSVLAKDHLMWGVECRIANAVRVVVVRRL